MTGPATEPRWRHRWVLYAAGALLIAGGLRGVLIEASRTRPLSFATLFIGGAAVHDAVLVPLVLALGWLVVRRVPTWARGVVQGALLVSGSLVVVALPALTGQGRRRGNPSALPQNYWLGLGLLLLIVWLLAGAGLWWSRRRRHPPARRAG